MADSSTNQPSASSSTSSSQMEYTEAERKNDPILFSLPTFPADHPIQKNFFSLIPLDTNAKYSEIYIDGIRFPSMIISGEARIPLSLFKKEFAKLYPSFELDDIRGERAIHLLTTDLNCHLYHATLDQVCELRKLDSQLYDVHNIDMRMITKTDVERVLGRMRTQSEQLPRLRKSIVLSKAYMRIPVRHSMFGESPQLGYLFPERKEGRCIQCHDCQKFFLPEHFIMHSHTETVEISRTVHWGSTSESWRFALYLDEETEKIAEYQKAFEEFCFDDSFVEDEFYPEWLSKKSKEDVDEPSKKKCRVEESEDELMELSDKMVQVLEGIVEVPVIPTLDMDSFIMNKLSITEEKLRAKATAEAMNGKIFDLGQPATSRSGGPREQDVQERALQIFRTQQPHIPDPERFPPIALENNGSQEMLQIIDTLKLLEATYPDGKPPAQAQALIDTLRARLQQEAFQMQQHELIYSTLLSAYKMLNMLWRAHTDPTAPIPTDTADFGELAAKMAALDPLHFLSGQKQAEPIVSIPEPEINFLELYMKAAKSLAAVTSPSAKGESNLLLNPFAIGLMSPDTTSLLAKLTAMNATNPLLNGLGGVNGLNGLNGKIASPSSSKAASFLQPFAAQQLPTTLVSPKASMDSLSDFQKIQRELFHPLSLLPQ